MRLVNRLAVALLLVTMAGTATFAKTKKERVEFDTDVKVNGTLVKAGTYYAVFDDVANELSIVKNGKVVAKTTARFESRDRKARSTQVRRRMEGNESELLSVTFGGSDKDIVLGQAGMQAGGNN